MPQSLAKNLVHLVFSTKNREPVLTEAVRGPLCEYAAAVLIDLDSPVIATNAWRDHVHILIELNKNHSLSQIVMEVKRATSKWIKTQGREFKEFHWQSGYGAFSIGQSGVEAAKSYIANQAEHHRMKSFQEVVLRSFLKTVPGRIRRAICLGLNVPSWLEGSFRTFSARRKICYGFRDPGRCPGLSTVGALSAEVESPTVLRGRGTPPADPRGAW